jgi:ubiquinone/menaquinone biosynthesis C-methylase UbiE
MNQQPGEWRDGAQVDQPRAGLPWRVIRGMFKVVTRVAPGAKDGLQKRLIGAGYNLLSAVGRQPEFTFINFGYALNAGEPGPELLPEDQADHYSIQLYHRVLAGTDLRGKDVLEVGSGRGGGCSYLQRYHGPRSVVGLDYAATAVAFCRKRHRIDGLTFVKGDAEALPFPAGSFDVVLNVESSHNYPSFERFVREVERVLRPGGVFLFADMLVSDIVADRRTRLTDYFEPLAEESISANVLRAINEDDARRRALIEGNVPAPLQASVRNFAALKGTVPFESLTAGKLQYVRFVLRKAGG